MIPLLCTQCGAPLKQGTSACEYCGTVYHQDSDDTYEEVILYADDKPIEVIRQPSWDNATDALTNMASAMASAGVSAEEAAASLDQFCEAYWDALHGQKRSTKFFHKRKEQKPWQKSRTYR